MPIKPEGEESESKTDLEYLEQSLFHGLMPNQEIDDVLFIT